MELEVSGIPLVDDALKEIENDESFQEQEQEQAVKDAV